VKQNNIIQLLLINKSANDAVEISNFLRNNGLNLRPKVVSDGQSFSQDISHKNYDIILFSDNIIDLNISLVLKVLHDAHSDAAVIFIGQKTAEETLQLLKQGVSSVVNDETEELLALTIKKEFTALCALRIQQTLNKQLDDSEHRCLQLIDSSRDAIAYIHEGMHILSNDPYYKMFGYESRDDIEAMPIMDLVSASDNEQLKETLRFYSEKNTSKADTDNILKLAGIKDNGDEFQIKMEFQPATMEGEECIQIIIRNDILSQKDKKMFQEKLATLNSQCQETGLYNRIYFLELLKQTVETIIENNSKAYLFFISLDKFIDIKKKLGDIDSDKIIIDIANLIKNTINDDISLARYEGYRFSAIVNTEDEKYALQMAEKIRLTIDNHIANANNKSISTTCSIGISQINSSTNGAQSILTQVQKACATAIDKGGNQISLYIPDAGEMDKRQLIKYWANEIDNAIKQKRMFLVFQPFINLLGEGSENFEVFIRLRNEQGNTIFPQEFLPPAEASEHSIHIDRWVIAEAMRILSGRIKAGHDNRFIIKLTGASLSDKKFIAWVKHNLERYALKPENIIFQVKAYQAAENLRHTQQLTHHLHQLGCKFSFEHFGKEENAFSLLKHIKTDFLKLDIELIQNISTDTGKLEALTQVCAQANDLGVKTIVPFIEEAGSLSVIWQSGAHFIQGTFLQEASESLDFDFSSFS